MSLGHRSFCLPRDFFYHLLNADQGVVSILGPGPHLPPETGLAGIMATRFHVPNEHSYTRKLIAQEALLGESLQGMMSS